MMLTGVILAGGTKRMIRGTTADLLPLASETLLERQIGEMGKLCGEIIIVTEEPRLYLEHVPRSVRIITDFFPNRGPLGGLHAALALSKYAYLWVTGSAMPFISAELARLLWEHVLLFQEEAAMPEVGGTAFPLHGIYRQSCLHKVGEMIESNSSEPRWEALLERIACHAVPLDGLKGETAWDDLAFSLRISSEVEYEKALQLCPSIQPPGHNYWQRGRELWLE